jgi:hypothetical protein
MLDDSWVIVGWDSFVDSLFTKELERIGFIDSALSPEQKQKRVCDFLNLPIDQKDAKIAEIFGDTLTLKQSVKILAERMNNYARSLVLQGKNVIMDIMQLNNEDPMQSLSFFQNLKDIHVFSVLHYCSPDELMHHVNKRNALGLDNEHRPFDMVMKQFCKMYVPANLKDQTAVDLLQKQEINHLLDQALIVVKKDTQLAQKSGMDQPTFEEHVEQRIHKTRERFFTTFFASDDRIAIIPHLSHSMVVNTGKQNTLKCAQQIKEGFEQHLKMFNGL